MKVTLDGKIIFEDRRLRLEAGSVFRQQLERAAAGLDGVVSIDLGLRGRRITQKGVLRAISNEQLAGRIAGIEACMDGLEHSLEVSDGRLFEHLRVDRFEVGPRRFDGGGVSCDYEIRYTQLRS